MSSPILLGSTQMCEHGLGSNCDNTWGGWSGSGYGVGYVQLFSTTIAVKNGSPTPWVFGSVDLSCWTSVAGSKIQGQVNVDGGGATNFGLFYFNTTGEHTQWSYQWYLQVSAGTHTINAGLYIAAGSINFDSNDGGVMSMWEKP